MLTPQEVEDALKLHNDALQLLTAAHTAGPTPASKNQAHGFLQKLKGIFHHAPKPAPVDVETGTGPLPTS